jgi:hypothetical protein
LRGGNTLQAPLKKDGFTEELQRVSLAVNPIKTITKLTIIRKGGRNNYV